MPELLTPQQILFEKAMRLFHGERIGDIKAVIANLQVIILAQNSSNIDEAILQYNELSLEFERLLREKYSSLRLNDTQLVKVKFHGG